jgi:hypothetical protein
MFGIRNMQEKLGNSVVKKVLNGFPNRNFFSQLTKIIFKIKDF